MGRSAEADSERDCTLPQSHLSSFRASFRASFRVGLIQSLIQGG